MGFTTQLRRTLRRGLLQGYVRVEESVNTLRGRLRFDDQLRRRHGRLPPLEVAYDEFTEDILENRLLRAALTRLGRLTLRSAVVRQELRAYESVLRNVTPTEFDPQRLPTVAYTRLNLHYRPAVELALLILRSTGWELRHGAVRASSFLVDMNEVFESFVAVALREALGLTPYEFPRGNKGRPPLHLDEAGLVRLRPDLSWWEGPNCVFVGDAKYKRIRATGVLHPDLYQLLAYTVAADLPAGLLVYAAGEGEPAAHRVVYLGKRLHVHQLDLARAPEQILDEVRHIAAKISDMRPQAAFNQA